MYKNLTAYLATVIACAIVKRGELLLTQKWVGGMKSESVLIGHRKSGLYTNGFPRSDALSSINVRHFVIIPMSVRDAVYGHMYFKAGPPSATREC